MRINLNILQVKGFPAPLEQTHCALDHSAVQKCVSLQKGESTLIYEQGLAYICVKQVKLIERLVYYECFVHE